MVLIGLLAAITLWQRVGIWRSATNGSRKTGRRLWPQVAKMLFAFNLLGATFQSGTTRSDLVSILGALNGDLALSGAINKRSTGGSLPLSETHRSPSYGSPAKAA